jgi:hypothetical protein
MKKKWEIVDGTCTEKITLTNIPTIHVLFLLTSREDSDLLHLR